MRRNARRRRLSLATFEGQIMSAEQIACRLMLAEHSIRRLFALRNHPRDGAMARAHCRLWLPDARYLRQLQT